MVFTNIANLFYLVARLCAEAHIHGEPHENEKAPKGESLLTKRS